MTEIKNAAENNDNESVSIETAKVVQGMSLVFCGALTMLEALHPHVSLAPSTILDLVTGNTEGLKAAVAERELRKNASQADAPSGDTDTEDIPQTDVPAQDSPMEKLSTSAVTANAITKVIVRKLKQDRSNSEKIGSILRTYGVTKVSELPESKYEAFLTDISQL